MMSIFRDLKELINAEIKECEESIQRRKRLGLLTPVSVRKLRDGDAAKYAVCYSEDKTLNQIDVYTQDAVLFRKTSQIPKAREIIEGYEKIDGYLGVIWWQSGEDFIAIFDKNASIEEIRYWCVKAEDILSLKVQIDALNIVENKKTEQGYWLHNLIVDSNSVNNVSEVVDTTYINKDLNDSQKEAIKYALSTFENEKSFYIIHGPPGTGKTTTIAEIIAHAIESDKKVLLTSHTNVAINNAFEHIAERYPEIKGKLLRIAHPGKAEGVEEFLPKKDWIYKDITKLIEMKNVIGLTLSKLANMTFLEYFDWNDPFFDVAIIDESSMITFPLTFIGLLHSRSFILVGDHHQLPPIIRGYVPESVRKSLFEFFVRKYRNFSTMLDTQYRSNEAIMALSNRLIYKTLKTAEKNKDIKLNIKIYEQKTVFDKILDPKNVIVWVETSSEPLWIRRISTGTWSATNREEAAICLRLFKELRNKGIEDIGIVTYYRLQSDLITKSLSKYLSLDENYIKKQIIDFPNIDELSLINYFDAKTIDSYQGKEKDVIILSFVHKTKHEALDDYRRLNVALTRAKKKLIVIGNYKLGKSIEEAWSHIMNPYNLYQTIKDLEKTPIRDNYGLIVSIDENELKDELKIVEDEEKKLSTEFKSRVKKSPFTSEDRRLLRELRKYRRRFSF